MTFEELRKALKEGKALTPIHKEGKVVTPTHNSPIYVVIENGKFVEKWKENDEVDIDGTELGFSVKEILDDDIGFEIYEKPILDEAEKMYLSEVIRPFRKDHKITISRQGTYRHKNLIHISLWNNDDGNYDSILLPRFKAGEMYTGMEFDKEYSLEELGL